MIRKEKWGEKMGREFRQDSPLRLGSVTFVQNASGLGIFRKKMRDEMKQRQRDKPSAFL